MKRSIFRAVAVLLLFILLTACGGSNQTQALEQCGVWKLGERYSANYSSLMYMATYEAEGEVFFLRASRNAKQTGMSKRVIDSRTEDGIVYALCESKKTDSEGKAEYTYYECYTGSFRYVIERQTAGFRIESVLSMDNAIDLIGSPESPKGKIKLRETEWSAQYRSDAYNLEVLIRPNDKGALISELSDPHQAQTENGETCYISDKKDDIVYTDGVNSIQIWQARRAGQDAPSYLNIAECKAILALLKSN